MLHPVDRYGHLTPSFCSSMPMDSEYEEVLRFTQDATDFFAKELTSDKICKSLIAVILEVDLLVSILMVVAVTGEEIDRWSKVFSWMDDDKSRTYFELATEEPDYMKNFSIVASKTYARGLVLIMVYYGGNFYVVMEDGEGDQPLLVGTVFGNQRLCGGVNVYFNCLSLLLYRISVSLT